MVLVDFASVAGRHFFIGVEEAVWISVVAVIIVSVCVVVRMVMIVPVIVFFRFVQGRMTSGLVSGAVKG